MTLVVNHRISKLIDLVIKTGHECREAGTRGINSEIRISLRNMLHRSSDSTNRVS